MARMYLKPDADLALIRDKLRKKGIIVSQRIDDRIYVIYKKRKSSIL